MTDKEQIEKELQKMYDNLSVEAKRLIGKVLDIENQKLHMGNPHGIYDEILKAIDEVVE